MLGVYLKSCELTFIIAFRNQFITMIKIGYIVFNYKDYVSYIRIAVRSLNCILNLVEKIGYISLNYKDYRNYIEIAVCLFNCILK